MDVAIPIWSGVLSLLSAPWLPAKSEIAVGPYPGISHESQPDIIQCGTAPHRAFYPCWDSGFPDGKQGHDGDCFTV